MDSFSWTDGLRATVSTCLPCFTNRGSTSDSEAENEGRTAQQGAQSRYEELEGLLGDAEDTDGGAETMSLHSNLGDGQRRRKKKRRAHKTIRLFGYNLFGRPPIQLSDSEDDSNSRNARSHRHRPSRLAIGQLASAHSSSSVSAFDSDASPLDAAAISQLTARDAAARAAHAAALREAEEQRRREEREEKEERRRRRRERRDLKRVAAALSNGTGMDGEEFEGFQGSGGLRSPFSPGSMSSTASPSLPRAPMDGFGPYVGGFLPTASDDPADGEADFGGEVYARKTRSRGSDSSRSHSQSQTSASRSNADSSQYNHHHLSQGSPLPSPPVFVPGAAAQIQTFSSARPLIDTSRQKKKKRSLTETSKKSSSSPTSQSASLPSLDSPVDSNFTRKFAPSEPFIVEQGEVSRHSLVDDDPKDVGESKFPSVGFGGVRRMNSTGSGVFLARRGDD